METKFNFKSQICTTRNQSERLLALGLKKETADMVYSCEREEHENNYYWELDILESPWDSFTWSANGTCIPAWSLGRLLELIKHSDICNYNDFGCIKLYIDLDDFETCITMISYMIKEGYFNKEYLCEN